MAYYLALGASLTGSTFTEVSDANYLRRPSGLIYSGQGRFSVLTGTHWPGAAAPYSVSAIAIADALSGGNLLYAWSVPKITYTTGQVHNGGLMDTLYTMNDLANYSGGASLIFDPGAIIGQTTNQKPAANIVALAQMRWAAGLFTAGT